MVKETILKKMLEKKLALLQSVDPFKKIFTVYAMVGERDDERQALIRPKQSQELASSKG